MRLQFWHTQPVLGSLLGTVEGNDVGKGNEGAELTAALLGRVPSQRGLRTSLSQPLFSSRFADFPFMDEQVDAVNAPMPWERRPAAPESCFYNPPAEVEWRHQSQRASPWGEPSGEHSGPLQSCASKALGCPQCAILNVALPAQE